MHDLRGETRIDESPVSGLGVTASTQDQLDRQCGVGHRRAPYLVVVVGEQPDHDVDGRVGVEPRQLSLLPVRVVARGAGAVSPRILRVPPASGQCR